MDVKRTIQKHSGRYWLIFGTLSYLGAAIPSIFRSVEGTIGDNAYMAVDWLAACVIYFFLGALFGHLADWWLLRKQRVTHPLWFWLTIALWVTSTTIIAIFARDGLLSFWLILFFPFAFGIFLTGSAFTMIARETVQTTLYGKLVLDLVYLAVFGAWLYLFVKIKRHVTLTRVLLVLLFATMFLGLAGCVKFLS